MLRLSLLSASLTRLVLCVLFILMPPTIGHIAFSVAAQSSLSEANTKQETALVSTPLGSPRIASGLSVFLPKSVKYKISVVFESTAKNEKEKELNRFRRLRIYKPSTKFSTDCLKQECWRKVIQLSNNSGPLDWDLDSKITKVLVTSWTPSFTEIRMGLPDEFRDVVSKTMVSLTKGKIEGVKITFTSSVGVTLVTIMPR